jgi:hypothetical protein
MEENAARKMGGVFFAQAGWHPLNKLLCTVTFAAQVPQGTATPVSL